MSHGRTSSTRARASRDARNDPRAGAVVSVYSPTTAEIATAKRKQREAFRDHDGNQGVPYSIRCSRGLGTIVHVKPVKFS